MKKNPGRLYSIAWPAGLFLFAVFCGFLLAPLISDAAYDVYLRNGRVIMGADDVLREAGKVGIFKSGVILSLPDSAVLRIEESKGRVEGAEERIEGTEDVESMPAGELPEYMRYDESLPGEAFEEPEEPPFEEEAAETEAPEEGKTGTTGAGAFSGGKLQGGPQLNELRRLEKEQKLPEQFKPYKDFLEKQYQIQKQQVEGE